MLPCTVLLAPKPALTLGDCCWRRSLSKVPLCPAHTTHPLNPSLLQPWESVECLVTYYIFGLWVPDAVDA
jgi:hypothetical protein